jgi:SAM-dependent methyltransferase
LGAGSDPFSVREALSQREYLVSTDPSVYYQHTGNIPIASRISYIARKRMFNRFMAVMKPQNHHTVLDIGVTSDLSYRESNYFEKLYPYQSQITCVGTEDGSHLEILYPGLRFRQIVPGERLPFEDKSFDIAFSNAVIEHVGNSHSQRKFAAEACRVAKRVFITTPNRWFPVEPHTSIPLLHYLPKSIFRSVLSRTPFSYWADEQNLNLLTAAELRACFSLDDHAVIEPVGVGMGPLCSNLVAYT